MKLVAENDMHEFHKSDPLVPVTLTRRGHDRADSIQDPGGAIIIVDSIKSGGNTDPQTAPCDIRLQILQDGMLIVEFNDKEHLGEKFPVRYMIQHLVCPTLPTQGQKPAKLIHHLTKDLRLEVSIEAFENRP